MTHTPGRWERRGNLLYTEDEGLPGEAAFLGECANKDDAAFIVRACNAHEELIAAARNLLNASRLVEVLGVTELGIAEEELEKTIAKAEGRA